MIDTAVVGTPLPARAVTLSVRRMLAFAAGIGDATPALFDDAAPGFVAHPALCVALEWPVVSDPASAAALVPDAAERLRAVHLVQDSSFHQPLRAGTALVTSGSVTGVWRGGAGVRLACTLHTASADGQALVSSRTVAVYRGVSASGADRPPADEAAVPAPEPAGAPPDVETDIPIDAALPHRYSECSGIWNPIHTERRVARAAGLPDIVLHGSATWALAGSVLVTQLAGGDPTRLRRLRGRFAALVFPDSRLTLQAQTRRDALGCHVHFSVLKPTGEAAIADGYAFIADAATPA